jgi:hypothetical protein
MKAKWYICTLFLLFTLFGAFQDQVSIPNQEIILEFVDTKINKNDIKNTIANVKEKLLEVGVSNIKIKETESGALKISYYSIVHIDSIKEALVKENTLVLNKNSENKENNTPVSDYSFNIYELTNEIDISNHNDKFVFEMKYNSDRFTTNYNSAFVRILEVHKANQLFKTAYKANKNNPFTKDYTSCKEPEVRAGPHYFNS